MEVRSKRFKIIGMADLIDYLYKYIFFFPYGSQTVLIDLLG